MADVARATWRGRVVVRIFTYTSLHHSVCGVCFINRGKGKRISPIWARLNAAREGDPRKGPGTSIKGVVAANKGRGLVSPHRDRVEDRADNPRCHYRAHYSDLRWGNYFGELIRSIPLYYPSWQKIMTSDNPKRNLQRYDTFYSLHTVITVLYPRSRGLSDDDGWELEATVLVSTPLQISNQAMVRGGKLRGHFTGGASGKWRGVAARDSEGGFVWMVMIRGLRDGLAMTRVVVCDMFISIEVSPRTCSQLGNLLPPWHQFLDQKIRGAHFSLGIVAGERFAIELTPSTFPQRHFAGDRFPQRHVAGEMVGMLLGKASNVVVD
ncbi:hypothetical protein Tco_0834630, partial [Tanacetum coccineum]